MSGTAGSSSGANGSTSGAHSSTPPDHVQAREAVKATRIAKWALSLSLVGVLASMGSVGVSIWSVLEQRGGLVEQKRVNDEVRAERQVEYATQVSWWPRGADLKIQNRSPVPIRTVMLRFTAWFADGTTSRGVYDGAGPVFAFVTVAPCTVLTIDMPQVEDYYLGPRTSRPNASNIVDVFFERLDFSDVHGRWAVTSGGQPIPTDPVEINDWDIEGSLLLSDLQVLRSSEGWIVEEPASDCGAR
jgi:hypothetical protein